MRHANRFHRWSAIGQCVVLTAAAVMVLHASAIALDENPRAPADGQKAKPTTKSAETTAEKTARERGGAGDRTVTTPPQEENANPPGARAEQGEGFPWPYVVRLQHDKPLVVEGQVLDSADRPLQGAQVTVIAELASGFVPILVLAISRSHVMFRFDRLVVPRLVLPGIVLAITMPAVLTAAVAEPRSEDGDAADRRGDEPQVRTVTLSALDSNQRFRMFEPHIAVDAENPLRILVGAMYRGGGVPSYRLLAWCSEDGGRSWSEPTAPLATSRASFHGSADPVVAFGVDGDFWVSGIDTTTPDKVVKVCPSEGSKAWKPPIAFAKVDNDHSGGDDKQWVAVDRTGGSRHGTVYLAWSKHRDLRCAALRPGAREFTPSVRLGKPILSGGHHVQLVVCADGTVHAVWRVMPSSRLVHAYSKDGAATFSEPLPIASEKSGVGHFPSMTVTPNGGLLVAWVNEENVLFSVHESGRWSEPRPVDEAWAERGRLSHPALAATVDALWMLVYRRERNEVQVVLYRSADCGKEWHGHCILASRRFVADEFRPGDYVGLAGAKDRVCAAYVLPVQFQWGGGDGTRLHVSVLPLMSAR